MTIRFENYTRSGLAVHSGNARISAENLYYVKEQERNRTKVRLLALVRGIDGSAESKSACQRAINSVRAEFESFDDKDLATLQSYLEGIIRTANRKVFDAGVRENNRIGYGASLVLAAWVETGKNSVHLYIAHVGCCRVILVRNGDALTLTTDQSWLQYQRGAAQYQQNAQILDQITTHANRDEVTDYLGRRETITIGSWREPGRSGRQFTLVNTPVQAIELQKNDRVILMTARPTDNFASAQLANITGMNPSDAANYLVDLTNKEGGVHNAAVVLSWTDAPVLSWKRVGLLATALLALLLFIFGSSYFLVKSQVSLPTSIKGPINYTSNIFTQTLSTTVGALVALIPTAVPTLSPIATPIPPTETPIPTNTETPIPTPTSVATPTKTVTATPTPEPSSTFATPPTPTQTLTPTNTPTPASTATNTPIPTITDTATPQQTTTSTPTLASTPTPAVAGEQVLVVSTPFGLSEINVKEGDTVNFNWQWGSGDLHDSQAFEVRVWAKGERNNGIHDAVQSKVDSSIRCEAGRCTFPARIGKPAGEYLWSVAVVTIKPAYDDQNRNKYESSPAKLVVSSLGKPVEPTPAPECDPNITNCNQ